jgi:predicted RNA-binding Zn-ribbon protein involved in translation (DUF1610 family)
MNFKAAICPSCGGQLQVPDDRDSVKCMYCGSEIIVREAIQKASGPDPANYIRLAKVGISEIYQLTSVDKRRDEKSNTVLEYCNKALEIDFKNSEAWYLRGTCAGMLFQYGEMRSNFENAIQYATNETSKQEYITKIVNEINKIISCCAELEGQGACERQVAELEFALTLKPDDVTTMKNLVKFCAKGFAFYDKSLCMYQHEERTRGYINKAENDKLQLKITKMTETLNTYGEKIKKLDSSYANPPIMRRSNSLTVTKKHFWE